MEIYKIVLIGAGNLATHIGKILKARGRNICQVYSRTQESAEKLAAVLKTDYVLDLHSVRSDADLYIVSVSDKAYEDITKNLSVSDNGIVVHTAGSVPMDIFEPYFKRYGVFYPLQTFSKGKEIDFTNIPFCIEANSRDDLHGLMTLAQTISNDVRAIDSVQRKQIHLAAVFVCNFTNHMFALGEKLLSDKNVNFDILYPLMKETIDKAIQFSPKRVQTGPAIRYDENVISNHIELLSSFPQIADLYLKLSQSIHNLSKEQ